MVTRWTTHGFNDGGQIQRVQAETFARGNLGIVTDGYGEESESSLTKWFWAPNF